MSKKIILGMLLFFSSLSAQAADSLNVRTVGSWPFGNTYSAATCSVGGHHIAVIGNGGGIMTANIDTPSCPRWLGEVPIGGFPFNQLRHPRSIKVFGNYAYLSLAESGMGIVDIGNPDNPTICSQTLVDGKIVDMVVYNNYAYAADDSFGLRIFNVENPYNPIDIALVPNTVGCLSLAIKDTILFIGAMEWWTNYTMIAAYNISQPDNPVLIDSLSNYSGGCIVISNNYIYSGGFIDIIDISDPSNINQVNNLFLSTNGKIALNDTLIFCPNVTGFWGFYIVSVTDPANPYVKSEFTPWGYTRDIYYDNNLLYVSNDFGGLRVIDISAPSTLVEIGAFKAPSRYEHGQIEMCARSNYLYYPIGDLYLLDITDTAIPKTAKWGKTLGASHAVALKDSIILTIDDAYGFKAMQDVGNKYLSVVDSLPMSSSNCWDIYCMDTLALVASSESLFVINVSDAGNIHIIGQCGIPNATSYAAAVTATSQYAYVAAGTSGFYIVDLSNLTNPEIVDTINIGMVWDLTIDKDILCLANDLNGLLLMNIDIPDSPKVLSVFDTSGKAMAITADSLFAYIADDSAGLRIIDISEPANTFETGYYAMETVTFPLNNRAVGVAVENGNIFVSHYYSGLKVYQYYGPDAGVSSDNRDNEKKPATFLLKDTYPNPARNKFTISYQLPAKAQVRLSLYNIAGQLVGSLDMETQQPGYYNIPLKTDKLSSGVYFYKLTAGNNSQTRKFIVLK